MEVSRERVIDSFDYQVPFISSFSGDTSFYIKKTLTFIDAFDSLSVTYDRDSADIEEKTTEGGELFVTQSASTRFVRAEGELFGEMGKLRFKFYLYNAKQPLISCVVYEHVEFDKPMNQPDMKMLPSVITYEIYCSNKLIAVLNKKREKQAIAPAELNTKEQETKQFIKNYIDPAKLIK